MNRNIALSLFMASSLVLSTTLVHAEVHFSLNVIPNDVSDFSQGATWQMVAKSDTPNSEGIVGLVSQFTIGTMPPSGTVNPNINHNILGGNLGINEIQGLGVVEFLYGQNPIILGNSVVGYLPGVGLLGGPSDLGPDFLGDPFWDNASEIAFGTIPDLTIVPELVLVDGNETFEAIAGTATAADIGVTVVRILPEPTTTVLAFLACPALLRRRRG